jgi:hypothetical protein
MALIASGCGGHRAPAAAPAVQATSGERVAREFVGAVEDGQARRALKLLGGNAALYEDTLPSFARQAASSHLHTVRSANTGNGHFRYWVTGKRRGSDGEITVVNGYFDVILDRSHQRVDNWQYQSKVTIKIP